MEELKRILSERFEREYEEYSAMLEIKRSEMARLETEMKKKKLATLTSEKFLSSSPAEFCL